MDETNEAGKRTDEILVDAGQYWGRRRSDASGLQRVGSEQLIVYDGKQGLFTPLTGAEGTNLSQDNLEAINEVLRAEVVSLQQNIQKLKLQLKKALEKPVRTPDDFASAISNSVDCLQTRLGQLSNPLSNFTVREMELEANVHVDVTPLGTIDYRFIQPGDDIPAYLLSKLRLTLSPIPKPTQTGVYNPPDFTPLHDIDDIQGIGVQYRQKLNAHNIYTVTDLLNVGTRARSKAELVALLEVDRNRLDNWLAHAELLTVRSIDGHAAEVLYAIGVQSLARLAEETAAGLVERYNAEVARRGHATLRPIAVTSAQTWIDAARAYTGYRKAAEDNKQT
jgi:hypothetical protein